MEKVKQQIRTSRPDITESSLNLYTTKLKPFFKNGKLNQSVFKNAEEIIKIINEKYKNISTRKSVYTALVVYLKSFKKPNTKLINFYSVPMLNNLRQEQSETFKQEKTDKQKNNWISMEDFVGVINTMYEGIKDFIKKDTLTNAEYGKLQDYIIVYLYLKFPLRNDLADLIVIKNKDEMNEKDNYLLTDKEYKIILQSYKTSKKYGKREYPLDKKTAYLVKKLLKHSTSGYLLSNRTNRAKRLTKNNLTITLQGIFKKYTGKRISTSMLRHIQASDARKDESSLEEQKKKREAVEDRFLHSNLTNQLYAKKDD